MALNPKLIAVPGVKMVSAWATQNPCFSRPTMRNKTALMLHSTATPGAMSSNFIKGQNKANAGTSVEFWADNEQIIQMFPVGPNKGCVHTWHCGSGPKGSYNGTHVACEMCEPIQARLIPINFYTQGTNAQYPNAYATQRIQMELKHLGFYKGGDVDGKFGPKTTAAVKAWQKSVSRVQTGTISRTDLYYLAKRKGSYCAYDVEGATPYFNAAYNNVIRLFAQLCKTLGAKPANIVCHSEGCALGYASNHGDVMHWFPYHGKDMDAFRKDVQDCINGTFVLLGQEVKRDEALDAAVDTLHKNGVINTPSIWKEFVNVGHIDTNNVYALLRQAAVKVANMSYRYSLDVIENQHPEFSAEHFRTAEHFDKADSELIRKILSEDVGEWGGLKVDEDDCYCMDSVRTAIREIGKTYASLNYQLAVDILREPAGINSPDYWKAGNYGVTNVRYLVLALATVFGDPDRREQK